MAKKRGGKVPRTRGPDARGRAVAPVSFRVSAAERARLEAAAGATPVAEFSRSAALAAADAGKVGAP